MSENLVSTLLVLFYILLGALFISRAVEYFIMRKYFRFGVYSMFVVFEIISMADLVL